jgi:hypothetical protein
MLAAAVRLAATGHGGDEAFLPGLLSATGLYSDIRTLTVATLNRPYAPQYPLWTDGAAKRRWVRLPDGAAIDVSDIDAWDFPVGTRFWKEFAFAGRRVETRLLVKVAPDRWVFGSYRWNEDQTDAVLAPAEGVPDVADVAPGVRHSIPSREDCRACHDSNRTEILGFSALQLSDDRDRGALHAEALAPADVTLSTLVAEGRLTPARPEFVANPPRIPAASAEERAALGYLSTNCGACHNRASTLAPLGLVFRQPAYQGGLAIIGASLTRRTKWDRPGAAPETTHVVDAVDLELSALLVRMRSRRPSSQMPPLGSVVPDHDAVRLVTRFLSKARLSQVQAHQ